MNHRQRRIRSSWLLLFLFFSFASQNMQQLTCSRCGQNEVSDSNETLAGFCQGKSKTSTSTRRRSRSRSSGALRVNDRIPDDFYHQEITQVDETNDQSSLILFSEEEEEFSSLSNPLRSRERCNKTNDPSI